MASNSAGLDFTPTRNEDNSSENQRNDNLIPPSIPPPISTQSETVKEGSRDFERDLINSGFQISSNNDSIPSRNSRNLNTIANTTTDPLGLGSLPAAGSFVPNFGYIPRINHPPINLSSRPSVVFSTENVQGSSNGKKKEKIQDRRAPSPEGTSIVHL